MLISRCHRLGKLQSKDKPRAIIARFLVEKDRMMIWSKKTLLKHTPFLIREDFPIEVTNRRKLMVPLFLEAKKRHKMAKLIADKVTYNKRLYSYQQAQELAQMLHFFEKGQVKGHGYLAFHGRISPYSNFFPSSIKDGGMRYNCSEQLYQHEHCLFHGEAQAARSIMLQMDPVEMKRISAKVVSQNAEREKIWLESKAKQVMRTAVYLKFSQNSALRHALLKTTESFVEANQYDNFWGVGLAITDKAVLNSAEWKGTNWLGAILTEVRDDLAKTNPIV